MPETFVDSGTTFRKFKTRSARRCGSCRQSIPGGDEAWKPSENKGGWKPDAVICESCGERIKSGVKSS